MDVKNALETQYHMQLFSSVSHLIKHDVSLLVLTQSLACLDKNLKSFIFMEVMYKVFVITSIEGETVTSFVRVYLLVSCISKISYKPVK